MGNALVGCALIVLPDEAACEVPGLEHVDVGWQLVGQPVTTLPDGKILMLPLDILVLIDEHGGTLARFALPDDKRADRAKVSQLFNFGSNLLLTTLLGVSRVHKGAARRSTDGRILYA